MLCQGCSKPIYKWYLYPWLYWTHVPCCIPKIVVAHELTAPGKEQFPLDWWIIARRWRWLERAIIFWWAKMILFWISENAYARSTRLRYCVLHCRLSPIRITPGGYVEDQFNIVLSGRYRILNRLGSGGMAEVYRAFGLTAEALVKAAKGLLQ